MRRSTGDALDPAQPADDALLDAGRAALAHGAWAEAREHFGAALARSASVAAYEGLGVAARYALDAEAAVAAHEAGFRLARERSDPDGAARLAIQLAYDAYAFRGVAEAMGWAERAAMLVRGARRAKRPRSFHSYAPSLPSSPATTLGPRALARSKRRGSRAGSGWSTLS